ncbi:MAG: MotA/TolQ/ExbB proton channel family protein [Armatimonadota bacterium]|nr:MotA/TolQ/ExbB proton channel family protein [Armatimonadota bacterium]
MGWFSNTFEFLCKGGPVMVPLMACSIASIAIMIERIVTLRQASIDSDGLMRRLDDFLKQGNVKQALRQCESTAGYVGNVLAAALRARSFDPSTMERAMQEEAAKQTPELHRRLSVLDTIITIAPLLGLLGTVTGMIKSFHVISTKHGMSAPTAITGGVAEALIATATGLAIAIGTLIGYNYLNERVSQLVSDAESRANHLINLIGDVEEHGNEITVLSA